MAKIKEVFKMADLYVTLFLNHNQYGLAVMDADAVIGKVQDLSIQGKLIPHPQKKFSKINSYLGWEASWNKVFKELSITKEVSAEILTILKKDVVTTLEQIIKGKANSLICEVPEMEYTEVNKLIHISRELALIKLYQDTLIEIGSDEVDMQEYLGKDIIKYDQLIINDKVIGSRVELFTNVFDSRVYISVKKTSLYLTVIENSLLLFHSEYNGKTQVELKDALGELHVSQDFIDMAIQLLDNTCGEMEVLDV